MTWFQPSAECLDNSALSKHDMYSHQVHHAHVSRTYAYTHV